MIQSLSALFFQRINMSDRRRLVFSILKFCSAEMQSNQLSDDAKESLEVNYIFFYRKNSYLIN